MEPTMGNPKIITIDELVRKTRHAKSAEHPALDLADYHIRGLMQAQVEQPTGAGDARVLTFIVRSTAAADRNGYSTNPDGWEVDEYLKNPVFLWGHLDTLLPVGKSLDVWSEGGKLKIRVEFTPAGMVPFNDTVFEMYRQGFLNAVSAGWLPIEYEWVETETGWEIAFSRQRLVEVSAVPVPADPGALRVAASAGLDVTELRRWAAQLLDEPRFVLSSDRPLLPEAMSCIRQRFAEFYPSAKLLILEYGLTLASLEGSDHLPLRTLEPDDLHLDPAFLAGAPSTVTVSAGSEPAADPVAEGTSAPAEPLVAEGIRASRDWRIRQLALLE
jgi:hypothetical protein